MYKLLDYDITEYKQLENTLNELSKQGYNPTSLGKISRFEKNEKHYYFHVGLLIKKPATPKRKALHDFINEYEKQMLLDIKNNVYDYSYLKIFNERFNSEQTGNCAQKVIDIVFKDI